MARSVFASQQSGMNTNARAAFISKTYGHLFGAVAALIGLEYYLLNNDAALEFAGKMMGNWMMVLGGFMLISWIASFFASKLENKPLQYIGLGMYVGAEALILLPLLLIAQQVTNDNRLIFNAAMITISAFGGLSAIAFITRKNFSFLKGVIMYGFVIALILICCNLFFGLSLGIWFSVAMVALAGCGVLYTTSNIIHEYHEEMYVGAAMALFASLATMFWYILRIVIAMTADD
ncbi:MAG: Bax inhibitor-1 family protein [Lentisphaeraceae bacterium]|nr:Bax inhibitor-1 family protein [Lentisphaeraceae bacterium]